jgi:hypothetical protein
MSNESDNFSLGNDDTEMQSDPTTSRTDSGLGGMTNMEGGGTTGASGGGSSSSGGSSQ